VKRGEHPVALYALAGAAAVAAGVLSLVAWRDVPAAGNRLGRHRDTLVELSVLKGEAVRLEAGIAAAQARCRGAPEAPATILSTMLPDLPAPQSLPRNDEKRPDGWTRRRIDLVYTNLSLVKLEMVASALETRTPAWRVAAVKIRSGPDAGRGDATLTVEAMERRSAPGGGP
jgi:hypothetical protein